MFINFEKLHQALKKLCFHIHVSFDCFFPYSSTEYLFQLVAVLVHHGDMHSGHFVTYRRSPSSPRSSSPFSSQWLWVSDDSVRKASLHEVLSSSAYMLFYERVRKQNPALCSEEWPEAADRHRTVTAACASYNIITNRWIVTFWQWHQRRKPSYSNCRGNLAS